MHMQVSVYTISQQQKQQQQFRMNLSQGKKK